MKKRIISLVLLCAISMTLCVPAFAVTPTDDDTLPPWVKEGEIWVPADGIMPLEDFGNCPKGHTGPSGYTFQGYTTGKTHSEFDTLALVLSITSQAPGVPKTLSFFLGTTAATIFWAENAIDRPEITYFKYVYTKPGGAPFIHIIYCTSDPGFYCYLTCETYYEI